MYPLTPPTYQSFTCQVCGTSFNNNDPLSVKEWEYHKARWTKLIADEKSDIDFLSHLVEKPFRHNFHLKIFSPREEVEVNISIENKVLAILSTGIHCDDGYKIMALFENYVPDVYHEYDSFPGDAYNEHYIDISFQKTTNPFGFFCRSYKGFNKKDEMKNQNIISKMKSSELIEINDSEELRVSNSNMDNLCKNITDTLDKGTYTLKRTHTITRLYPH